jgi:hypothetical protein
MWISKAILISLAAAGCAAAEIASGAFQRLPPMPVQTPVYIKKTPTAKAVVVGTHPAQKQQCAIPLLNVTPDSKTHFTAQMVAPPNNPVGAMKYVTTLPTCGKAQPER